MISENSNAPIPPIGVIESLAQGFEIVAGHVMLLLLPLLLDLFLWFGPRVTFSPAIEIVESSFHQAWTVAVSSYPDQYSEQELPTTWDTFSNALVVLLGGKSARYIPMISTPRLMHFEFQAIVQGLILPIAPNLISLDEQTFMLLDAPTVMRFRVPSLMVGREANSLPFDYSPPVWAIKTPLGLVGLSILLLLTGFCLGCFYSVLIAQEVRGDHIRLGEAIKQLPTVLFHLAIYGVLAFVRTIPGVGDGVFVISPPDRRIVWHDRGDHGAMGQYLWSIHHSWCTH